MEWGKNNIEGNVSLPLTQFSSHLFCKWLRNIQEGQRIMKLKITNGKVNHYLFLQNTLQLHKCEMEFLYFWSLLQWRTVQTKQDDRRRKHLFLQEHWGHCHTRDWWYHYHWMLDLYNRNKLERFLRFWGHFFLLHFLALHYVHFIVATMPLMSG